MANDDNDMNLDHEDHLPEPDITEEAHIGNKRARTASSSVKPAKPRKKFAKRAPIWEHFLQREDDSSKSNCRYCGVEIGCDSKSAGTSPMISHNNRCKMFKDYDEKKKQKVLSSDNKGNLKVMKYDPQLFRRSVNEMVVLNELAFSFVESEGWKRFCFNVLPMYSTFSRRTCTKDIVGMYLDEKAALKKLFGVEKQRVSLTTDIWVSQTTSCNYMVVTGHWIDASWEMQKRILQFKVITDHKGDTIAGQLKDCLDEWGIEKVFTVTADNAKGNDKALKVFTEGLRLRGPESLVLNGDLLHMRCCAHILNLIVGDGLKKVNKSIVAIRNSVKYVRSGFNRLQSFALRCEVGKACRGSLPLDVVTRWNSTYLMMSSALKLRVPFERMELEDKLYCDYFQEEEEKTKTKRVGPPTSSDWDEVSRLVKFLKIFFNSTLTFSASQSVTSTLCYNEIVTIERNLITKCGNKDEEIRKQAHIMRDKFEKYWDGLMNMNPLVIIASVFDPRNKMKFASLCFDKLYGKETIENRLLHSKVSAVLTSMYEEYSSRLVIPVENATAPTDSQPPPSMPELSDDDEDDYERIDTIYSNMVNSTSSEDVRSELETYLAEKTEKKVENSLGLPYDVLSWWKCNSSRFPVLSEIARDVLATQASSVASESVFSTSGRVLDPFRSSLTPYMVQVLICTQQWLRCNIRSEAQVANLAHMLEEFEFFESLGKYFQVCLLVIVLL